jgi:pilus assembly protein Flp/PilA
MLKYYIKTTEALKRLRSDKKGVVSFEYVIVAACVVAAVAAAFGTSTSTGIGEVLDNAITAIGAKVSSAVTPTPAPAPAP